MTEFSIAYMRHSASLSKTSFKLFPLTIKTIFRHTKWKKYTNFGSSLNLIPAFIFVNINCYIASSK